MSQFLIDLRCKISVLSSSRRLSNWVLLFCWNFCSFLWDLGRNQAWLSFFLSFLCLLWFAMVCYVRVIIKLLLCLFCTGAIFPFSFFYVAKWWYEWFWYGAVVAVIYNFSFNFIHFVIFFVFLKRTAPYGVSLRMNEALVNKFKDFKILLNTCLIKVRNSFCHYF